MGDDKTRASPPYLRSLENSPRCEESTPSRKRLKLSLRKPKKELDDHFRKPVTAKEHAKSAKGVVPTNTKCATVWALRNFQHWRENRNKIVPDDPVPMNLFENNDAEVLCKWLCCFVQETRKESGENYPGSTLRQMLSAFQRVLRTNQIPFNIFDQNNLRFNELRNTLDSVCVGLRKQGIGAEVSHAPVISYEHETMMWESGALGFEPPDALLRAVFVTVGMYFSLRGGQEHYDLKVEQFTRVPAVGYTKEAHYKYVENGSKNYQGRFSECSKGNKIVEVFAEPESERCPVRILDSYLSKLPENPPAFYLQ